MIGAGVRRIVVMGVAASGKSTIGAALAVDLGLAFLPSGGHGGERAIEAERAHGLGQRGIEALWPEQAEASRHEARTFTVSPTASSMRRSSS